MSYVRELLVSHNDGYGISEIVIAGIILFFSLATTMSTKIEKHRNTDNSMLFAPAYLFCIMYIIKKWYPNAQLNKFIIWLMVANITIYIIMCKNHVYYNLKHKTGYCIGTLSIVWNVTAMILIPILTIALMCISELAHSYQQLNIIKNIQIVLAVYNFICLIDLRYSSDVVEKYKEHTECYGKYAYVIFITLIYALFQLGKASTPENAIRMLLLTILTLVSTIVYLIYVMYNNIKYRQ